MQRCIEIAKNGLGYTRPNPMVGCVIVYNNIIIGEGFTSPYGQNHAEVNAIQSVSEKGLLKNATLYVTLEPCTHFGKTPPCSDAIIKAGIRHVVIGTTDTNSLVAGKGAERLKANGCRVDIGVLEDECKAHHKRFFTAITKNRPFVILKWAQTVNGFIAPLHKEKQEPVWISNIFSRQLTHKWRTEEHAILVGGNTILQDNPELTARYWKGQNPIRVVLDNKNNLNKSFKAFNSVAKTICLTSEYINFSNNPAKQIVTFLHKQNIQSVIIEGGLTTLQQFIDENLWDEARIFTGAKSFKTGINAPKLSGTLVQTLKLDSDSLTIFKND